MRAPASRSAWPTQFRMASAVGEREHPPNSGLVPTARCCGRWRHRQTNSVRVCSPASRRVATLRPRFAGLTALTPAPRTLVQTGSCRRCPLVHPLHVVVDALFRMTLFPATVDIGRGSELPSQFSRRTSGPNHLDHLLPERRRVRRPRFRHRGTSCSNETGKLQPTGSH